MCSFVEFVLDNASLVNICNDYTIFERMTKTTRILWYGSGTIQAAGEIDVARQDLTRENIQE